MKRFLFLFFASLFALTTWAYSFSDDSTGTTFYCTIVDDVAGTAEIAPDNFQYAATQSYCIDELVVPETLGGYTVIGIGADAFDYCTFKAVSLPSTLQYIQDSGFWCCTNMTEIDIPEGVTVIESSAFYQCTALKSVNIPSTVTTIGSQGFYSCTALSSITCLAVNPPSCAGAFDGVTTSNVTLYVPSESVGAYQSHSVWGGFNVQAIGSGGTSGGGDHEGDYLTPEIMGYDMTDSGKQEITYVGPSGTEYYAYTYVRLQDDYPGDFNFTGSNYTSYLKNTTSVGYLRKLIVEADENYTGSSTLTVRASDSPYTGTTKAEFTSYGTVIGSIALEGGTTLELTDDYEYFIIAGDGSGTYVAKSIELVWETEGSGDTGGTGTFSCTIDPDPEAGAVDDLSQITFSNENGIYYNEEEENGYDGDPIYITDEDGTTITQIADITAVYGTDSDGNETEVEISQIVEFEEAISEDGTYYVIVPASFFYSIDENGNKGYNEELKLCYTFEGANQETGGVPEGYVLYPADQAEVPSLSEIIISLENDQILTQGSNFTTVVVKDEADQEVTTITLDDETDYGKVICTIDNEITTAGTYTITFPQGVLWNASTSDPNPEFKVTYYVTGETGGYELIVDPESGKTLESLSEFSITCAEGLGLNNMDDPLYVMKDGEVVAHAWGDTPIMDGVSYIGYNFVICDPSTEADLTLTDEGTYTIEVPDEYFVFDDESLSERFTITYYIGGSEEPTGTYSYVVDPVEGQVESLSYIELTSDDEDVDGFLGNYVYAEYTTEALVYNRGERGDAITTATMKPLYNYPENYDYGISLTLKEEITEPGSYVVVIPEGSFYWVVGDDLFLNDEIDLSYYIEALQGGEYSFTPADGSTLTSLESFDVCHSISICCAWDQTLLITVEDENGNTVAYGADCVDNWPDSSDDPCLSCTITLNTKIVAAGMYTISIPAGYFVVGENDLLSEALTITYIVDGSEDPGTGTGIGGISINDENVEGIYSTSGQKLNKAQKGVNIIRYTDGSVKKLYVK